MATIVVGNWFLFLLLLLWHFYYSVPKFRHTAFHYRFVCFSSPHCCWRDDFWFCVKSDDWNWTPTIFYTTIPTNSYRLDMCRRNYPTDVCNRGTAGKCDFIAGITYTHGDCAITLFSPKTKTIFYLFLFFTIIYFSHFFYYFFTRVVQLYKITNHTLCK